MTITLEDGSLLGCRQSSFTDGVVAEDGDERKQDIDKLLQQGTGSSSQDFGAEARMSRRRSVAVTGARVDRSKDVGGKTGGGKLAVSFRTPSTLVVHTVCIASGI